MEMNDSILNEIRMLRKNGNLNINRKNSNRYRLLVHEEDASNTAYYFSTPIYGLKSRKLIDLRFRKDKDMYFAEGSNTNITVSGNEIIFKNSEGTLIVSWGAQQYFLHNRNLISDITEVYPTLNGVAVKVKHKDNADFRLHICVDKPFMNIRENTKCFALMSEGFIPFMTVSSIGTANSYGKICSPAKVSYHKIDDRSYYVNVTSVSSLHGTFMFEINLYEPKLFQDTTVESKNANENNAFGSTAFIGDSETFGEQWLYSRLDYSKISEVIDREIRKMILHIPRYNDSEVVLAGFEVAQRFCSFGSNWDNKIALARMISESSIKQKYQSIDITDLMVNRRTHSFNKSEGMILRSKVKGSGFTAIATGDNYYTPQILEINFK